MRTNRDHNRPAIPASPRTPGKLSLESRRFTSLERVPYAAGSLHVENFLVPRIKYINKIFLIEGLLYPEKLLIS